MNFTKEKIDEMTVEVKQLIKDTSIRKAILKTFDEIMALPHAERIRWCEEISGINRKVERGETGSNGTGAAHRSLRDL